MKHPKSWVEPHGNKYRVRYRMDGKKVTAGSAPDAETADMLKGKTDRMLARGDRPRSTSYTFDHLLKKLDELLAPQRSPGYMDLIHRSLRLLRQYAGARLKSIRRVSIDAMIAHVRCAGDTEATVNKYLRHCAAGLQKAVEWGMLEENPFDDIKYMREPERTIRRISEDEEVKLIDACDTLRDRCIVYLALDAGLRAKEIANLNLRENFDKETGAVLVANRGRVTTKSKRERTPFVLDEERRYELVALMNSRRGYGPFPFYDRNARSVSERGVDIFKKARVKGSLHDLRRTCATRLLLNGMPVPLVARWMGHTIKVMQEFYARITDADVLRAAAEKVRR